MTKKLTSLALALALCLSLCVPAFAAESSTSQIDFKETDNVDKDFISEEESAVLQNLIPHRITFTLSEMPSIASDSQSDDPVLYESIQRELAKMHNANVVQGAKEFVQSLNLANQGLKYIEDFCLEELDYYMTMEDAQLTAYTVYTPEKTTETATKAGPSLSDLTYFGSYSGRDFYFYYPSSAQVTTNVQEQSTTSKLQSWANGVIDFVLLFTPAEITVPFTLYRQKMNAPSNYTVRTGAFVQSFANLEMFTRCLYTSVGTGYNYYTSQQFANVFPYMVFHPVDTSYNGSYNIDFNYQGQAFSSKYKNSTQALCKEAWEAFNGSWVVNPHDRVNLSSFKMNTK